MAAGQISTNPVYNYIVTQAPTQIPFASASDINELKDSHEITWDFTNGITMHVMEVPGRPSEAILDSRLGGSRPGSLHPWASANKETVWNAQFMSEQTFRHLVRHDTQSQRFSKVTSTYRQQPCPHAFSLDVRVNTRSVAEWYSKKTPYRLLTGTYTPIQIPQPRIVIVRRYPRVAMSPNDLITNVMTKVGARAGTGAFGLPAGAWLFEGVSARMLYGKYNPGSHGYDSVTWDITMFLEADPERLHNFWYPKPDPSGNGLPWVNDNITDRSSLHNIYTIYDTYEPGLFDLIPMPNDSLCAPRNPPQ